MLSISIFMFPIVLLKFSPSFSTFPLSSLSILITSILNSMSSNYLSPFCLVLFMEFCSVLSFGPRFFVSSFWLPPCVCVYVLGGTAMSFELSSDFR